MRIIYFIMLSVFLFSCSQKKNINNPEQIPKTVEETTSTNETYNNKCFEDRAPTKEVSKQEAEMVKVMGIYMFRFENTRWQPCSVPPEFQQEGLKVKVSGKVLEIRPNERRAGTPFSISSLERM